MGKHISHELHDIDWENEFSDKSVDEMLNILYDKCYSACELHIPKRKCGKKFLSKTERYRRKLCRRRRKINKRLTRVTSVSRKNFLMSL